jgi:hypothetical protein
MGLDMYLHKKYYVMNWDHTEPERRHHITIKRGGKKSPIPTEKICYIETEEIYWRKANAIHAWFVNNAGKGIDNCQAIYVSRDDLKKLLHTIDEVLRKSKLKPGAIVNGHKYDPKEGMTPIVAKEGVIIDSGAASELLPTQDGFFFGGTDYDEFYYGDLVFTKKELERLMAEEHDGGEFYYEASW